MALGAVGEGRFSGWSEGLQGFGGVSFFRLFLAGFFDGGSKVFAWLWSGVVLQARWGGAFRGWEGFLWAGLCAVFLAENVFLKKRLFKKTIKKTAFFYYM
ncbi:hypothetical protein ACFS4T_08740 [Pseudomonas lini]